MALKVGSEAKWKVVVVGVLGVIILYLAGRMIVNNFSSPAVSSSPAMTPAAAPVPVSSPVQPRRSDVAGRAHEAARIGSSMAKLDPTLHPEWMAEAESLEYTGKGRNIFSMSSALPIIEAVNGPVRPVQTGPMAPAGPPPPPPIDLKFFGFEYAKGGARKAFLLHGEDIFIAAEGDVVDHRYKVVKIAPLSLQVEDIPYHNTQTLPLVQN